MFALLPFYVLVFFQHNNRYRCGENKYPEHNTGDIDLEPVEYNCLPADNPGINQQPYQYKKIKLHQCPGSCRSEVYKAAGSNGEINKSCCPAFKNREDQTKQYLCKIIIAQRKTGKHDK